MKLHKLLFTTLALGAMFASCTDYLEQEPPSYLTPEGFFSSEDKVQAAANGLYASVLPGHGNWSYGTYANDVNTDNQMNNYSDTKYGNGLWLTSNTNSNWSWTNIRDINFQLNKALEAYEAGEIDGSDTNIRQYIGELYFLRAYAYFTFMKNFGDMPIVTVALNDDEAELVEASKRQPHNEVARFILSDLDTAMTYMKEDFEKRHTRISYDAALLFKSRVALYEGSWLTYFAGTPFVAGGNGWPGAAKDYNANYTYPSGSIENEAKYFLTEAANAAETIAEKYKSTLRTNTGVIPQKEGDAENPYFNIWGSTDMSDASEVILWREYSKSLSVVNCVEVAIQHSNYGSGVTRSMVESYLMKDGKPIYNSAYTYKDGTVAEVATDRDPRLTIFLKVPGQKNVFKNMSATEDHYVEDEPLADITNKNAEDGYVTGYAIRKGGTFDKELCGNGNSYNGCVIFRATEALLNYMEAEYMLTQNLSAGHILEYWRTVREKAGFTGDAINPETTINATDMSKETLDWGAYSAGQLLSDKTLYNIRRERRCELLAEGLRDMDLKRWRAMDQMINTPFHMEGIHLWNSEMEKLYTEGGYDLTCDGSGNATVSAPSLSEYYRPLEVNMSNNSYKNGWVWHMAHYLQPLPLRQFLLSATDHASVDQSPLYQNPYWPTTTDSPAEQ
jgi:hypothetical protein